MCTCMWARERGGMGWVREERERVGKGEEREGVAAEGEWGCIGRM